MTKCLENEIKLEITRSDYIVFVRYDPTEMVLCWQCRSMFIKYASNDFEERNGWFQCLADSSVHHFRHEKRKFCRPIEQMFIKRDLMGTIINSVDRTKSIYCSIRGESVTFHDDYVINIIKWTFLWAYSMDFLHFHQQIVVMTCFFVETNFILFYIRTEMDSYLNYF